MSNEINTVLSLTDSLGRWRQSSMKRKSKASFISLFIPLVCILFRAFLFFPEDTFEIKNVVWQPCRVSVNHYGQWTWWLALLCTNITSKEGVQPMRLYKRRKTHRNQNSFITNLQMFRHRLANWLVVLCLLTTYIIGSSGHPYSYIDEVLYASSLWNYLWQTSHSHGAVIPGLQPIGGIGLNSLKGIGSMLLSLIRVVTNTLIVRISS